MGDASAYAPVTVAFASVTVAGTLKASTTPGPHPSDNTSPVDEDQNVNRYWTLTNSGITFTTCSATFGFGAGDVDPGATPTVFLVGRYSGSTWSICTTGTRTSTSTQATGLTAFGDFEVGQPVPVSSQSGSSVSTLTWSHTVSNLVNRVLVVGVTCEHASSFPPSSVKYGGVSLTQIGSVTASGSMYENASLWYLLAPAAGTANVVVTWSSTASYVTAGAMTISGIAQLAPEASATGVNLSGAASTNITTKADSSFVVDIFASGQAQGDLAPAASQTLRFINDAGATASGGGSFKIIPSPGTTTMSWTQTGINRSAQVVAAFAPAVYYSKGNTDVSVASNWNTARNGTGTNASAFGSTARWTIQNGHSTTLAGSTAWNVGGNDRVTIENGGTWTNTSAGTVTLGTLAIQAGGSYVHGTSNALPGTTRVIDEASSVTYSGTSQTVAGLAYGNLTIASSGTRTLGGNATVAGNLAVSGGTLDLSTFTLNQATPSGTFSVSNGATLRIGGTGGFPAGYAAVSLFATSTTEYYGASQQVSMQTYGHLTLSGGGVKTAEGPITVAGNLAIGVNTTFSGGDFTHVVQGNWSNSGTFDESAGTITLSGSAAASVTGAGSFAGLVINKASAATAVTLNSNVTVSTLTMTQGRILTGSNVLTLTSGRTGDGVVIGTITRAHPFTAGTPYAFESPNTVLTFTASGVLPGSVTVSTVLSSPGANDCMDPINRYYTISHTDGAGYTYTLRLHYEDGEVIAPNAESSPPLKIWRRTATGPDVWTRGGATAASTTDNWVELSGVTSEGTFSLSSRTIAEMVLQLNADASHPSPGDLVTFQILYTNAGDGTSTNTLVTVPVPTHTTYVTNSTAINDIPKTDAADGDEVTVSGPTISINLGSISAGGSGTISYKVSLD